MRKLVLDASRAVAALSPVIAAGRSLQRDPDFSKMPKPLQAKIKLHVDTIASMHRAADAVLQRKSTEPLLFTMEEVQTAAKQGTRPESLASGGGSLRGTGALRVASFGGGFRQTRVRGRGEAHAELGGRVILRATRRVLALR